MIKKLGQQVELFNEYTKGGGRLLQMSQAALDVQMELASFYTYCIRFFRLGLPFALGMYPILATVQRFTLTSAVARLPIGREATRKSRQHGIS